MEEWESLGLEAINGGMEIALEWKPLMEEGLSFGLEAINGGRVELGMEGINREKVELRLGSH